MLSKPQRSLQYLLETVCGVATNKLLQVSPLTLQNWSISLLSFCFLRNLLYIYMLKALFIFALKREDWRQRPLSDEMVQYARTDAHYLLYIADSLIDELKQLSTGRHLYHAETFLCVM